MTPSQLSVWAFRSREPAKFHVGTTSVWYTRSGKYRRPAREYDHGVMLAIECTTLRILARDVAESLPYFPALLSSSTGICLMRT